MFVSWMTHVARYYFGSRDQAKIHGHSSTLHHHNSKFSFPRNQLLRMKLWNTYPHFRTEEVFCSKNTTPVMTRTQAILTMSCAGCACAWDTLHSACLHSSSQLIHTVGMLFELAEVETCNNEALTHTWLGIVDLIFKWIKLFKKINIINTKSNLKKLRF